MLNSNSSAIVLATIVVLASVVIFTGLSTPTSSTLSTSSAYFAKYCQDVDNVYSAVLNEYADKKVEHAIKNEKRTNEQIYIEVVTGKDPGEYAVMGTNKVLKSDGSIVGLKSTNCLHIDADKIGSLELPSVSGKTDGWFITSNGQIFNATGYYYEKNNSTYWNAYYRSEGKFSTQYTNDRVEKIVDAIVNHIDEINSVELNYNETKYLIKGIK